jgi:hypothetical protein
MVNIPEIKIKTRGIEKSNIPDETSLPKFATVRQFFLHIAYEL